MNIRMVKYLFNGNESIKRHLILGRKAMTNLDSVLKSKDIILLTKIHIVRALVFLVVMYGCESCTIKKAEHWRIDAFKLWSWRRLLRVPWTARRSNQSILKEVSPEYSLENWCSSWSFNTLAIWCEELTHWKIPWCWERLKAGEGDRGWNGWMASLTQLTWVCASSRRWWGTEKSGVLQSMVRKELDTTWWLNNNENKWMHLWEIKVTWPFHCIAFFLDNFMQFFLCYTFIPFYWW